ncbi:YkgJ family cysteine cluster protein [Algoriphagus marincola]|uniref:YkgJ family cysteine cluster protein n=1 Tax=Algoriphagus marincola TaxID=264027 RepID=A0ABS7N7B7_9BACT|nr:YkgJ family cysteine cluster protein [Algoriphagus marincola]MBY5951880.1 YkgJ family cysteine cluster protein [Algoriphagus marincola]
MKLSEKSQAVLEVFRELEVESRDFVQQAGLSCVVGCGKCCANPKVPASPLEFLPFALELYENGAIESNLRMLDSLGSEGFCLLYRPTSEDGSKGFCSQHTHRGLICRLFSSSARRNKQGEKELILCKVLKEAKPEAFAKATAAIKHELQIPMASTYYSKLADIDAFLTETYPINQAIRIAIELVLRYKFYEESETLEDY